MNYWETYKRNLKATIEYDGSHYCGFQAQVNPGIITIQETLEEALTDLCREDVRVISAGRTDSGVHALGQVINFYTNHQIPVEKIPYALNQRLPRDIIVRQVEEVPLAFHARKYALGKHYQYRVYNNPEPTAFGNDYFYWVPYPMDENLIRQGCKILEGTHNFKGFSASGSSVKTFTRTIYYINLRREGDWWYFDFYGNGFLYNMVRIIVGTLVEIGKGRQPLSLLQRVLDTQDRTLAGKTAPPSGLYLKNVFYP